jgi:hypothetical protein
MNGMRIVLLIAALLTTSELFAQQASNPPTPQLPPSEELKASTAPLIAARAQPDDMTQADLLAFSVGVSHAGRACLNLQTTPDELDELVKTPDELLAFAKLCVFGLQYDPARHAIARYLGLPTPPERETALLLLTKAFLGLNDPESAANQIFALEKDYPYDVQIHFAADQAIIEGALLSDGANSGVLALCGDQLKNTLPLLESAKGLTGKEANAAPGTLFADAVRCVDITRDLHDNSTQSTLTRLESIVQLPDWQRTAELAPMQSALARTEMVGKPAPMQNISGQLVTSQLATSGQSAASAKSVAPGKSTHTLRPDTLALAHGTVLLVPFALWTPSALTIVQDFHVTAPQQPIYLLTSWAVNTGAADEESDQILESLRSAAQSLPAHVSLLVVPDAVLQQFRADAFPGVIVLREGVVRANLPLLGDAAKRLTVSALGPIASEPKTRSHPHP